MDLKTSLETETKSRDSITLASFSKKFETLEISRSFYQHISCSALLLILFNLFPKLLYRAIVAVRIKVG